MPDTLLRTARDRDDEDKSRKCGCMPGTEMSGTHTILACSDTFPHHVTLHSNHADIMSHTGTLPESHVASQCIICALQYHCGP